MITNDKFKSVEHRVVAQPIGPRLSVACFFSPNSKRMAKPFGAIKELLSENESPIYREFLCHEYYTFYKNNYGLVTSALPHYKLWTCLHYMYMCFKLRYTTGRGIAATIVEFLAILFMEWLGFLLKISLLDIGLLHSISRIYKLCWLNASILIITKYYVSS